MKFRRNRQERDLYRKIKWLVFFRCLFAFVLLAVVTVVLAGPRGSVFFVEDSLLYLLWIAAAILILSLAYALAMPKIQRLSAFAYFQVSADTAFVTLIIFVTGSFASIFSFLYLVVIIYATMVIYRRGGMVAATLCALQYGIMVDLEYFGIIEPIGVAAGDMISGQNWQQVLFRLMVIIGACYLVAFLSGFLSEQERRAKKELWAMEDQMKRLERLAAAGEMAAGLTHEIKNPLASLSGSIQMLKSSIPYNPSHDRLMQIVLREADRLSALVTDFLLFSRPRPGHCRDVKIESAIGEVVALFRKAPLFENRVEIAVSISGNHYIRIDPEHFRQIIWNLLHNAADAMEQEGRIVISSAPDGRRHVKITVADNGAGIPEEDHDSVFNPFFSTKPGGTGLGLSIVQQIVGLYGGLVDLRSTPGRGTRVILKFESFPPPERSGQDHR